MKKRIYHTDTSKTGRGRLFRSLSALLTLGYYVIVVTLKIVVVKNSNKYDPIRRRAYRDAKIVLMMIPIVMVVMLLPDDCIGYTKDGINNSCDTVNRSPLVSDTLTFARPHARLKVGVYPPAALPLASVDILP